MAGKIDTSMTPTRQAAVALYQTGRANFLRDDGFCAKPQHREQAEQRLVEELAQAQEKLDEFRRGAALRVALDLIMPGWFDLDIAEYAPQNLPFLSADPAEWAAWLQSIGYDAEEAAEAVAEGVDHREDPS